MLSHLRGGRVLRQTLAILLAVSGAMSCQGGPGESDVASGIHGNELSSPRPVPRPIAGGDYFPASPHHRAGIIHQFYPADVSVGGDGPWAEPNGMTDFNGFIAQVFMGGTAVDNKGKRYIVDVDNRVYQGEYVGTNGEHAFGTFCEIWIDLYDPGSGAQVHDFSPGNGENIDDPDPIFHLPGLFWLVRIGEENFQFAGTDNLTAVLRIDNLLEFDRFQIMGPGNVAMHLSFDTTYRMLPGKPTIVVPLTNDPMSPNNWAGTIWQATAKGTFSASYDDGTFSVTGTMDSAFATEITPGHMGNERNGIFARSTP